jgi:hypothetical protein
MAPSTLTAMRWDDLSMWTTTSARAGAAANAAAMQAAASASRALTHLMMTPCPNS